jgi:uncharacterized protein YyaL (SSP411 family)
MDRTAIEWLIDTTVAALEQGEPVDPWSLTFLLRCYGATERADIRQALEPGLADALQRQALAQTVAERAAWLVLIADALALSADDRLRETATSLVSALRSGWGDSSDVVSGAASVDACLRASRSVDPGAIVQDAIDELERIVAAAYRPGAGLTQRGAGGVAVAGGLAAHVALSSALLTAYDLSGRLPYSMLAEELMQFARRTLWDDGAARFIDAQLDPVDTCFLNCDAARVLCGLAALHADDGYRAAAVIRPEAAYADDAARILTAQEGASRESGACRGAYGLALQEWLALR